MHPIEARQYQHTIFQFNLENSWTYWKNSRKTR